MIIELLFITLCIQFNLIVGTIVGAIVGAIVGLVVYFIRRHYDLKSKKHEINHSLFQQKRLESVNAFFDIYAKTEQLWEHLRIYPIFNNEFSIKELDEMIFPTLNELKKNIHTLEIYFNKDDYYGFLKIDANINSIETRLSHIYFDLTDVNTERQKVDSFISYRDSKLLENRAIISNITTNIKKSFD